MSTKSHSKYAPNVEGESYAKVLKDPEQLPAELLSCPLGKWHNPDGEHFTIETSPEHPWYGKMIKSGRLVRAKGKPKEVERPIASLAIHGLEPLQKLCKANGIGFTNQGAPALAKKLAAEGIKMPEPPAQDETKTETDAAPGKGAGDK